jgi:DNA-binding NarL/FixJ family response regulator
MFADGSQSPPEPFPQLTVREREVLHVLAGGHPNTEIARRLGTSEKTIRNHLSNIFTKIQVADRTQAVIRAREAGYPHSADNPRPTSRPRPNTATE